MRDKRNNRKAELGVEALEEHCVPSAVGGSMVALSTSQVVAKSQATQFNLQVTRGPTYNPHGGSNMFNVLVHLDNPGRLTASFTVSLYWSASQYGKPIGSTAVKSVDFDRFTPAANVSVWFSSGNLPKPPANARFLVTVVTTSLRELTTDDNRASLSFR